ncbi:ribosomal protein S18-alanine N-acetyltransferase [Desulfotalea psychrophila]|uniref:[Ribosomal protein bS18]-alanine N-acetyltransferase n=1 Tax=Desulfotalea psychrophila (strain LSv54 / DSM 12343) TaxID=177439 RepID=Q6AS44_DESPS|nr:ribosomal protein S18-alanine N-acetyltransferase [Desulfotalea psychrophila]CAG34831.1 related to N-terminal acetyltransferase [Desulfotalea psychrophila LSv54]
MLFRAMLPADLDSVVRIESQSPSPWSPSSLLEEYNCPRGFQYVLLDGNLIVGWCALTLLDFEAELLKIAIDKSHRGQGLGQLLLKEALAHLEAQNVCEIFLEVRSHNTPACRLYAKNGFKQVGTRKNYYQNPADDALVLKKTVVNN